MNLPVFIVFECTSFLVSLIVYFRRPTPLWLRLFPPLLLLTIATELTGYFIASRGRSNGHVYNVYMVVSNFFFYYVLYQTSSNKKVRRYILYTACLFPVAMLINFFIVGILLFHSHAYSFGAISIVIFSAINLVELMKRPGHPKLSHQPEFWITIGLLFFYACSFPIISSFSLAKFWPFTVYDILVLVLKLLVCLFYSLFTIGFLCVAAKRKPPVN